MAEDALTSLDITWHDGAYYVSVPNYKGGTVYTSECVDKLVMALTATLRHLPGVETARNVNADLAGDIEQANTVLRHVGQTRSGS